jgi:hypothetical protein
MTTIETASTDDELRAKFDEQLAADLNEIERLKSTLAERQESFKRRYAPVLAALERA